MDLQMGFGLHRRGQPGRELLLALPGDGVELALGSFARRAALLEDAAVAHQAGQGAVDLAVGQRLVAAEELVVLPLELVAVAAPVGRCSRRPRSA